MCSAPDATSNSPRGLATPLNPFLQDVPLPRLGATGVPYHRFQVRPCSVTAIEVGCGSVALSNTFHPQGFPCRKAASASLTLVDRHLMSAVVCTAFSK